MCAYQCQKEILRILRDRNVLYHSHTQIVSRETMVKERMVWYTMNKRTQSKQWKEATKGMTERLYLNDSEQYHAWGTVTACVQTEKGYEVELDRSIFFPNKGGQPCDLGKIHDVSVLSVDEVGDRLVHLCEGPVPVGEYVEEFVDGIRRHDFMQQHTGEHILSWCANAYNRAVNVGFHCSLEYSTLDLDIPLSPEQLADIESMANTVVKLNCPVTAAIYEKVEDLDGLYLRKHTEGLTAPIRVVTIEGSDSCTCCAPHVKHTGEIGLIKIVQAVAYKGGMRITFLCGKRAYNYVTQMQKIVDSLSRRFSTSSDKVVESVEKTLTELDAVKKQNKALSTRLEGYLAQELKGEAEDIKGKKLLVKIVEDTDPKRLRPLCQSTLNGKSLTLLLCPRGEQVSYILMSKDLKLDMGEVIQAVNTILSGKGGGRGDMAQGSAKLPSNLPEICDQLKFYLTQRLK